MNVNQSVLEGSFDARNTLFRGKLAEVILPAVPSIPPEEGIHLVVTSGHDVTDTPRAVAVRYLLGLGVAKSVAEGSHAVDAWANTRMEKGQRLSVYGRTIKHPDSWRKPVVTHGRTVSPMGESHPSGNMDNLGNFFSRYLPKWEKLAESMELFPEPEPVGKDGFTDIGHAYKLWEGIRHDVVLIKEPHLNGYHFVVSPKEGFDRQWQTRRVGKGDVSYELVQASVEGWAIAEGIWSLFGRRGEIHNSGNWADKLKVTEEWPEGRISRVDLLSNVKVEKRKHRPDLADKDESLGTHTHTHVYIPFHGDTVVLPSMKKEEAQALKNQHVLDEWEQLPKATLEDVHEAQKRIGDGKLTDWIAKNVRGGLV